MIFKTLPWLVLGGIIAGGFNMATLNMAPREDLLPEGIDPNDFEASRAYVEANGLPTRGLLLPGLYAGFSFGIGLGFLTGANGLLAMRPWYVAAGLLGILWMCGGVAVLMMSVRLTPATVVSPAPPWFALAYVVFYVPGALLGVKRARRQIDGATQPGKDSPPSQP